MFLQRQLKDEADIEGRTAFMWAASKGADDVLKKFIQYKVDMHQTEKSGGTGKCLTLVFSLSTARKNIL